MSDSEAWSETMKRIPLSFPILLLSGVVLIGLSALFTFHIKLNFFNETTNEFAKKTYKEFLQPVF